MQIILTQDVPKLGHRGDVKTVKSGYFRNFLLPRSLAEHVTDNRLKQAEKVRSSRVLKMEQRLTEVKKIAEQIKNLVLTFRKKVTAKNKLYGSISEKDIIEGIKREVKVELSKDMIHLPEHLKTLGEHSVEIKLTDDLVTHLKVVIEKE